MHAVGRPDGLQLVQQCALDQQIEDVFADRDAELNQPAERSTHCPRRILPAKPGHDGEDGTPCTGETSNAPPDGITGWY